MSELLQKNQVNNIYYTVEKKDIISKGNLYCIFKWNFTEILCV